jgi:bifunctional NMN adenylyltransferase/nudix hydrolase
MRAKLPITVVIGRFQPFHKGHLNLIRKALTRGIKTFVLLGSSKEARTAKNTWSSEERIEMIRGCFSTAELDRLNFQNVPDFPTDAPWVDYIEALLAPYTSQTKGAIGLIGYVKDQTSYYLRLFPNWTFIQTEKFCDGLSATDIRKAYFEGSQPDPRYLPDPVIEFLCDFRKHPDYEKIVKMMAGEKKKPQKQKPGETSGLRR